MAEPSSTPLKLDLSKYMTVNPTEQASLLSQNIKEDHIYYHFDYTVLIAIFMVCLTLVAVTYLKINKNKDSFK